MSYQLSDLLDILASDDHRLPWEDFGEPYMVCEGCGCSDLEACPGGCSWSQYYINCGRLVCSTCEQQMMLLEINLAAMEFLKIKSFRRAL